MHTAKILRLSTDLPMVIEIVDTQEKMMLSFLICINTSLFKFKISESKHPSSPFSPKNARITLKWRM